MKQKRILLNEERCQHERERSKELDEHVEQRACGVLERAADHIPDDRCLVGVALLSAVSTGFDVFLDIVPYTSVVIEDISVP